MESAVELCIQFFRFTVMVWITMVQTTIILQFERYSAQKMKKLLSERTFESAEYLFNIYSSEYFVTL